MKLLHEKIENEICFTCIQRKSNDGIIRELYNHWHSKMEISRIMEGTCECIVNGKKYIAKEGDLVVIKSGEIHRFILGNGDCKIYVCPFEPMFFYNMKVDVSNLRHHITLEELEKSGIEHKITECFENLKNEGEFNKKCGELIFKANLLQVYGLLLRYFEKKEEENKNEISKLISFQKILEYISSNCTENLTLKSLAEEFNYNYAYLSGLFRNRIGVNFKYYLDSIRVSKAMDLLITTDMTIAEVSSACGYENIRTFNNVFKRITGVVPSTTKQSKS